MNSEDIAFFAPAERLGQDYKDGGQVKGSVDNLEGKTLKLYAGNNTYLNGDSILQGFLILTKPYRFKANEFKTTYADAVRLLPASQKYYDAQNGSIEYVRFRGNFKGFIKDFVTYGTIETNLGTIVVTLNMKLNRRNPVYSGSINTTAIPARRISG